MVSLHPDVEPLMEEWKFNVQMTIGGLNGIQSDMGVEKTVIRDTKGQGGVGGSHHTGISQNWVEPIPSYSGFVCFSNTKAVWKDRS